MYFAQTTCSIVVEHCLSSTTICYRRVAYHKCSSVAFLVYKNILSEGGRRSGYELSVTRNNIVKALVTVALSDLILVERMVLGVDERNTMLGHSLFGDMMLKAA